MDHILREEIRTILEDYPEVKLVDIIDTDKGVDIKLNNQIPDSREEMESRLKSLSGVHDVIYTGHVVSDEEDEDLEDTDFDLPGLSLNFDVDDTHEFDGFGKGESGGVEG